MKINFICQQQKKEDKNIISFAEFYLPFCYAGLKKVDVDCPDKNKQKKAPDYFLVQPNIAVEIKEVHERETVERLVATGYSAKRLQEALDKLKNAKPTDTITEEDIRKMNKEAPLSVRTALVREIGKRARKDICLDPDQVESLKMDVGIIARKLYESRVEPGNQTGMETIMEAARILLGQWIAHIRLDCRNCIGHMDDEPCYVDGDSDEEGVES